MFKFMHPYMLLGIFIPLIVMLFKKSEASVFGAALKIPYYHGLKKEVLTSQIKPWQNTKLILPFIIWVLLVICLSRPVLLGDLEPLEREGHNIMLALDISASMSWADMTIKDRPVSRIAVVKKAARDFVKARKLDKIGLVLFGTRAYLMTPLTFDHQNVLARINDATVGLAGNATSIGDALGLSVKRLKDTAQQGRVIILLTDGANTAGVLSPLKSAELARDNNIKVYTIGLGSTGHSQSIGGLLLTGNNDLDESTLMEIAKITNGKYFRATDPKSLQDIYTMINELETQKEESEIAQRFTDLYPWFLALAILLYFYLLLKLVNFKRAFLKLSVTKKPLEG